MANDMVEVEERQGLVERNAGLRPFEEMEVELKAVQKLMGSMMKNGEHYGVIPGTKKPTLLKPGAELLCSMFRLAPEYEITDLCTNDSVRYRVVCRLSNRSTSQFLGSGVGECSSDEEKYKWRAAVCDEEFDNTDELRKRVKWRKGYNNSTYKVRQVRTEVADAANTILKMAKKRAHTDAVLTVTATSEVFTQDLEDIVDVPVVAGASPPERAQPSAPSAGGTKTATKAQIGKIYAVAKASGWADDEIKAQRAEWGYASSAEIPMSKVDEVLTYFREHPKK